MADKSIESVAQQLASLLPDAGWQVVSKEVDPNGIEDEVWRIQSTWSPQGAAAYLSFVINRHPPITKGKIWMVRASRNHPESGDPERHDDLRFYFEKQWIQRFPDFVKSLGCFRTENAK
jgi:hypothetical protein